MEWILVSATLIAVLLLWAIPLIRRAIQKKNDIHYCRNLFYYPRHGDED